VDGVRDLIDFFPLHLDLKYVLEVLPSDAYKYVLKHEQETLKFFEYPAALIDGSDSENAPDSHLRNIAQARIFKEKNLKLASTQGVELSAVMLEALKDGEGIILCETVWKGEQPLVLEIIKKSGNNSVAQIEFPMSVTTVQDMYRKKYFSPNDPEGKSGENYAMPGSPPNWPDEERNGKHFIFVHGYNVSASQSQGWHAEMFKRLYWSGSNAMFTGITWLGNESQIGTVSLDYWDNVLNAFQTSKDVAAFVNVMSGKKSIAAHSLGNMVVGSAIKDHGLSVENYFMIDAAVALEAYEFSQEDKMRLSTWNGYESRLWSTDWYKLFPANDGRNKLTWELRFGSFTNAHNFYSTEEEILKNGGGTLPAPGAVRSWVYQEMSKGANFITGDGIVGNGQGGWKFNFNNLTGGPYSDYNRNTRQYVMYDQNKANKIDSEDLKLAPFFKLFNNDKIINPRLGSAEAAIYDVRADILAEAIPAYSFAAGSNPIGDFQDRNQNMVNMKTDEAGWPTHSKHGSNWLHSDIRDVGYLHNYQVFDKISKDIAELNQ
jgi:hypothetical protein